MKITLIILALIILGYFTAQALTFYYKVWPHLKLAGPNQSLETLGSGPTLRYIAAGDSLTVGVGASSKEKTFPYQIAKFFGQTHTVEYKNIAVSGSKTQDVLEKQVAAIIAFNPDLVTISMGGNDATHLVSSKKVLDNYKTVIAKLKQGTTAKIYISNIPNFIGANILPWFFINIIEFRSESINKQILALQDDRVKIVNAHDFGWDQEPFKDRSKTYAADHFHPNDLGYQNWTAAFLARMK